MSYRPLRKVPRLCGAWLMPLSAPPEASSLHISAQHLAVKQHEELRMAVMVSKLRRSPGMCIS